MSQLLDVLLNDTQRMQERRSKPAPPVPVSRADQIIAEGDKRRREYIRDNTAADTKMAYAAQIGHLHAQVRLLCAELDALKSAGQGAAQ